MGDLSWVSFIIFLILVVFIFVFFFFFNKRKSIKSPHNTMIMDKLVMEVKGLNSSFDAADIRGEYYGPSIYFIA